MNIIKVIRWLQIYYVFFYKFKYETRSTVIGEHNSKSNIRNLCPKVNLRYYTLNIFQNHRLYQKKYTIYFLGG